MPELPRDQIDIDELLREQIGFELMRRAIGKVEILDDSPLGPIGELSGPIRRSIDETLDDEDKFREHVEEAVKSVKNVERFPRTTAAVTSTYLGTYTYMMHLAERRMLGSIDSNKLWVGALMHDFSAGFSVVLESVQVAHRALYLEEYTRDDPSGEMRTEQHLGGLLRQDETGFSIVDTQVEHFVLAAEFPTGILVKSYNNPEFVIAGAEMAQEYYRKLYPKIEEVLRGNA
ncbi:MAG: hypothetical protein NUV69_05455 [Candidatus Curtissbacteria bacterium]|nr:hypothetical protein [Candidatus Curtissbacteria bacterium]